MVLIKIAYLMLLILLKCFISMSFISWIINVSIWGMHNNVCHNSGLSVELLKQSPNKPLVQPWIYFYGYLWFPRFLFLWKSIPFQWRNRNSPSPKHSCRLYIKIKRHRPTCIIYLSHLIYVMVVLGATNIPGPVHIPLPLFLPTLEGFPYYLVTSYVINRAYIPTMQWTPLWHNAKIDRIDHELFNPLFSSTWSYGHDISQCHYHFQKWNN